MAILPIQIFPAEVLLKKAEVVDRLDENIAKLVADMFDTMYAAPGIGLAAPQVGVSLRIAVIDISNKETSYPPLIMVNPEIVEVDGSSTMEEGCLSLPGVSEDVVRPGKVFARFYDLQGKEHEIEAEDLLARAIQHEVDHLEGILFIDRINRLKRQMIKKRLKKKQQR